MIEIKKCSKSFGSVKAVDKVSLEIGEREVFGLVAVSYTHLDVYKRQLWYCLC